jgi:hypothetical protein
MTEKFTENEMAVFKKAGAMGGKRTAKIYGNDYMRKIGEKGAKKSIIAKKKIR